MVLRLQGKEHFMNRLCLVLAVLFTSVMLGSSALAELGNRPPLPDGHPDLTKGEGPDAAKTFGYWFLHCGQTKGWVYTPDHPKDPTHARQILLTRVPATSPVRHELKVGDVILGVSGKYFTDNAVEQFRAASVPAKSVLGELDIIVWRKGWEMERNVRVSLAFLPLDFTKGEKPGQETDWNLGPTGARGYMQGFNHESRVTRQIYITFVEAGSPADGILREGDVILGVEGRKFTSDARRRFAEALVRAESEEANGQFSVMRWRENKTENVIIPIKVMGAYSPTTPWNCPKNERILDDALAYFVQHDLLNKHGLIDGRSSVAALALLATGEPKYIEMARPRVYGLADLVEASGEYPPQWGYATWGWSYANLLLSEYHLLTGDTKVLPAIRKLAQLVAAGQSGVGSWGHNGAVKPNRQPPGYGALNQAGNIAWMSLLLARRCGISDAPVVQAIERGRHFLDGFIDTHNVPYGDGLAVDCGRHDDNGKCSSAAVAYGILGHERGTDYYARMTVASYEDREFGHTGIWWSLLWGPLGAARAGQPATTAFLQETRYLYDLERRWDGGYIYQGKMNTGAGRDENGRQIPTNEHKYAHWDTTAGRILMLCLPRRQLYITGRGLTTTLGEDQVPAVIEAGRPPAEGRRRFGSRFDDRSPEELIHLLGNWSPMVRTHAAGSLARKPDPGQHTPALIDMLRSDNRYARYGACMALRRMKAASDAVVDALVEQLTATDQVLQRQAMVALGASGNRRAIGPLLKMAAADHPGDVNQRLIRTAAHALFGSGMILADSIDHVDPERLRAATLKLLACKAGQARRLVTQGVVNKLTLEQFAALWPQVAQAMVDYPLTEVTAGSDARIAIAQLIGQYKIDQGPAWLLDYMKNMRQHDATVRRENIVALISSYGIAAKSLLPALKAHRAFLKTEPVWTDRSRQAPPLYHGSQVAMLEQIIQAIEQATASPPVVNIERLGE